MEKKKTDEILKEVYKNGFVILPSKEADNLKVVRKSAESIFQDKYFLFNNLEDFLKLAIELTSKNFEDIIDNLKDPYPLDVFPEIHEELFEEINQELINKFEFPLDRLSASLMRRARENLIEELKKEVRNSSQP